MRTTNFVLTVGLTLTTACAAGAGGSRGVTHREHVGSTQVIFTNATPQKMCELHMTYDEQRDMGDNWLPEGGLPSGKSIEFKIRPGKYQATWSTCRDGDNTYYAGTLIADTNINVDDQQTQLFAYIADNVAPTKRAPVLTRDYKIVKFSGQPIGPIDRTPVKVDAFAVAEASLGPKGAQAKTAPVAAAPEKFSAKGMIDPKAKRTAKRDVRPSLDRKHDVVGSKVKYKTR